MAPSLPGECRLAQRREVGFKPCKDRLCFRIPKAAVELEHVRRAVRAIMIPAYRKPV